MTIIGTQLARLGLVLTHTLTKAIAEGPEVPVELKWTHLNPVAVRVEDGGQLPASSLCLSLHSQVLKAHLYRWQLDAHPALGHQPQFNTMPPCLADFDPAFAQG